MPIRKILQHTTRPMTSTEISNEARALVRESEVIDLHLESFLPHRLFGYDLHQRHAPGFPRGAFFGHADIPRLLDGGVTGAMWSVTTNIFRTAQGKSDVLRSELSRLRTLLIADPRLTVVRSHDAFVRARREGKHAALLSIQGGNALEILPDDFQAFVDAHALTRVTLTHLTDSPIGSASTLGIGDRGLGPRGIELVRRLDQTRTFVDLAHASPRTFWDAARHHDRSLPLIDTHTGVRRVCDSWRNLGDDQAKAIADSGGTIGVIFHAPYLRGPRMKSDAGLVLAHIDALLDIVGEDFISLGSDYDGFIVPPKDLRDAETAYLRITQRMLDANYSVARIQKILGGNFLRVFRALRPSSTADRADVTV